MNWKPKAAAAGIVLANVAILIALMLTWATRNGIVVWS